ncbi:MAG: TlpA family protein disulfide reductase [Pseudomonadota bacterium]|jgi:thiol-disulfide isomerase/thioredoxin|nr:TlpA family protein disulfide reductase [Alphaproteobacteria bacterium]
MFFAPLLILAWLTDKVAPEHHKNDTDKNEVQSKKAKTAKIKMTFDQAMDTMLAHGFLPQLPAVFISSSIVNVQNSPKTHFQGIALSKKKLSLLHFWATWCGPCKRELPYFADFASSQEVMDIYAITPEIKNNVAEEASKIWDYYRENNIKGLNVCADTYGKLAAELKVSGIPATLLISPDGFLLGRFLGETDWTNEKLVSALIVFCNEFKNTSQPQ